MKAVIPVRDIIPNPFQARKRIPAKSVRALAEEIKELGLWTGSLKGRMKNGKLQLCYGHRRLQALKQLGWKDVEVEIEDLTDEEMAFQGMAENMQRESLSDIEKAEAIKVMIAQMHRRGAKDSDALKKVCRILERADGDEEIRWRKRMSRQNVPRKILALVHKDEDRRIQIWIRVRLGGQRMTEVAQAYGYRDGSGVHQVIRRLEARAKEDRELGKHLGRLTRVPKL